MADRIPFSLPGALSPWVDTDHAIGVIGVAGTITRVFGVVTDAPSGGDCTFEIGDATGGAGDKATVTILDGETYGTVTDDPITISSSEIVYLRPTAANGALNLSGWFEFSATDAVSTFLTSLDRVKTDEGISAATWDTQLSRIIQGVSKAMQNWMRRDIVDTTYTDEVHSGDGWTNAIILKHRPVTSTTTMVVKEDDVTVSTSYYTTDTDAGIIYTVDGYWDTNSWTSGRRNYKVTYSAGFTSVPEDIAMACTDQVRHEFHQTQAAGNRLGLSASTEATGGSSDYLPSSFLPSVLEIMARYRRVI